MEVECPHCKIAIEIWSDESEIECKLCGVIVTKQGDAVH